MNQTLLPCGCTRIEYDSYDVVMKHSVKCSKVDGILLLDYIAKEEASKLLGGK